MSVYDDNAVLRDMILVQEALEELEFPVTEISKKLADHAAEKAGDLADRYGRAAKNYSNQGNLAMTRKAQEKQTKYDNQYNKFIHY